MRRFTLAVVVSMVVVSTVPAGTMLAAQQLEFEVASIKRTLDTIPGSGPRPNRALGEERMTGTPARFLVLRAYPVELQPAEVVGLPSWADSERYDVVVRAGREATPEEMRAMWRALLADRMKLAAHYETRARRVYHLVVAREDGRLGPQLTPATACTPPRPDVRPEPPPPDLMAAAISGTPMTPAMEAQLLSRCHVAIKGRTTSYTGGMTIGDIIKAMGFNGAVDRPIIDQTGLTGYYAAKLTFWSNRSTPPGPDDPPVLFTALQEQLGLKLQAAEERTEVVVVDRIERPSEN